VTTLYFVVSGEFVKIGITRNLENRMRSLRMGMPHPMHLAYRRTVPAGLALQIERRMHEMFADRRVTGEWFRDLDPKEAARQSATVIRQANAAYAKWWREGCETLDP